MKVRSEKLRRWKLVKFSLLAAIRFLLRLLSDPPDRRRYVFNQTPEIQGLDHAYVKIFLERAPRMLRIAQTG